jgi:hypothetical protein
VSASSIALIESFATRGERMFYGIGTFRADLVRFVRLIRTYLHRPTPHFGSARQPTRAFHSSSTAFTNAAQARSRGLSLFSLTFCIIFFQRYGPTHGERNLRGAPPRAEPQRPAPLSWFQARLKIFWALEAAELSLEEGHGFSRAVDDTAMSGFTGCGTTQCFEGYGLQAVHNQSKISSALAAEG